MPGISGWQTICRSASTQPNSATPRPQARPDTSTSWYKVLFVLGSGHSGLRSPPGSRPPSSPPGAPSAAEARHLEPTRRPNSLAGVRTEEASVVPGLFPLPSTASWDQAPKVKGMGRKIFLVFQKGSEARQQHQSRPALAASAGPGGHPLSAPTQSPGNGVGGSAWGLPPSPLS